jgi:hypothetical protein
VEVSMRSRRPWTFVPRTQLGCTLYLLVGVVVLAYSGWQLERAGDMAVLPLISVVLGLLIIGVAVAGLVSPRLRSRRR